MEQIYKFKKSEFSQGMERDRDIIEILRDYYQQNFSVSLEIDVGNNSSNIIVCNYLNRGEICNIRIERKKISDGDENITIKFLGDDIDRAKFNLEFHLEEYSKDFRFETN